MISFLVQNHKYTYMYVCGIGYISILNSLALILILPWPHVTMSNGETIHNGTIHNETIHNGTLIAALIIY